MKRYFSSFGALVILLGLSVFGCSDDLPERVASYEPSEGVVQVYFPAGNTAYYEVEPIENSVSVTIAREVSDDALTVNLAVLDTAGVFTVPSSVSFDDGQLETSFDVSFEDLTFFLDYMIVISFEEELTNPYLAIDGTQEFVLRVMQSDWKSVAAGEYYSDFFESTQEQDLQYSEILDRYRFPNVWFSGFHFEFLWDGESAKVEAVQEQFATGYVHATYGMIYAEVSEEDSYYDSEGKQLVFDVSWEVPGVGSFGNFPEIFTFSE